MRSDAVSHRTLVLSMIVAAATCVSGCDSGGSWDEPGPKETFDAFLMEWFRGDHDRAFEYLSPEDREQLTRPRERLDEIPEEARPEPHELLVVAAIDNPYDIDRMEEDPELDSRPDEGQRVTLKLHYQDGSTKDATMVWGAERWYVDLPLRDQVTANEPTPPDTDETHDGNDGSE